MTGKALVTKGFTLIEVIVAVALLVLLSLVFFGLFKGGLLASNRGQVSAETREKARVALDKIQSELHQAVPITVSTPTGDVVLPPVILPGPGGQLANTETSSVGCSVAGGCMTGTGTSVLNPSVVAPVVAPGILTLESLKPNTGPAGFLIFSELKQALDANGQPYTPPGMDYSGSLANYLWVMYRVEPGDGVTIPARLVRYTFDVVSNGNLSGVGNNALGGGVARDDGYFVLAKSREGAGNGTPIVSLNSPNAKNALWFMVYHGPAPNDQNLATSAVFDTNLFGITAILNQTSISNVQSSTLPTLTATMSSQVNIEGAER